MLCSPFFSRESTPLHLKGGVTGTLFLAGDKRGVCASHRPCRRHGRCEASEVMRKDPVSHRRNDLSSPVTPCFSFQFRRSPAFPTPPLETGMDRMGGKPSVSALASLASHRPCRRHGRCEASEVMRKDPVSHRRNDLSSPVTPCFSFQFRRSPAFPTPPLETGMDRMGGKPSVSALASPCDASGIADAKSSP